MRPNIVIVEDNPVIALDLSSFIKRYYHLEAYRCLTQQTAMELLNSLDQAIVFLDINLDTKHAGIAIAKTLESKPRFPYVYITANTDHETLQKIKGTHPIGFIVKPYREEEIKAILTLAKHKMEHPTAKAKVSDNLIREHFPDLTATEVKMFLALYQGASNQELANELFVSLNTVKSHLKSIFGKLGVNSRLRAVQALLSKL